MRLIMKIEFNKRRYNMLISNEVTMFIINETDTLCFRNIILIKRRAERTASHFIRIEHFNSAYLSLHYVLFFSFKQSG